MALLASAADSNFCLVSAEAHALVQCAHILERERREEQEERERERREDQQEGVASAQQPSHHHSSIRPRNKCDVQQPAVRVPDVCPTTRQHT